MTNKIMALEDMTEHILKVLEEVTQDYPEEDKGRAQADILAAFFGGTVVEVNNG